MLALVIKEGKLERRDIPDTLDALQEIVGGWIQEFFTKRSPLSEGAITGYVNEEGLFEQLPINFGVVHGPDYIVPLAGDAVIVGLDTRGGSRGLTTEEADLLTARYVRPTSGVCPVIEGAVTHPLMLVPVQGVLNLSGW